MFENTEAFSSFSVDDVPKAKQFYGETLGLKTSDEEMGVLVLHLSGGGQVMVYPKPDHQPAVFTILNFPVDDIDQAVEGLTERGVSFERYEGFDQDEKGISRGQASGGEGPSIAWFEDPAGNILAVLEDG